MLDRDIENIKTIIKHTEKILLKIDGINIEDLIKDEDLQQILCFNILQIGELSNNLSNEFKTKYNNIPWKLIYGMRNIIVHGYGSIDLYTIYDTSKNSIPDLNKKLKKIIKG